MRALYFFEFFYTLEQFHKNESLGFDIKFKNKLRKKRDLMCYVMKTENIKTLKVFHPTPEHTVKSHPC